MVYMYVVHPWSAQWQRIAGPSNMAISRNTNSEFPILNISFRQVWGVSHKELSSFLLATIYTFRAAQLPTKYETTIDCSIH